MGVSYGFGPPFAETMTLNVIAIGMVDVFFLQGKRRRVLKPETGARNQVLGFRKLGFPGYVFTKVYILSTYLLPHT